MCMYDAYVCMYVYIHAYIRHAWTSNLQVHHVQRPVRDLAQKTELLVIGPRLKPATTRCVEVDAQHGGAVALLLQLRAADARHVEGYWNPVDRYLSESQSTVSCPCPFVDVCNISISLYLYLYVCIYLSIYIHTYAYVNVHYLQICMYMLMT